MDGKIKTETIDAINARSETIFEHYGVTLRKGKGKCPFHDDKKPSFVAKPDSNGKWYWNCMACNAKGGDIFSFVAQKEGLSERSDFAGIVKRCADLCGIYVDTDTNTQAVNGRTPKTITQQAPPPPMRPLNDQAQIMATQVDKTTLYQYLITLFDKNKVRQVMFMYKCGLGYRLNKIDFEISKAPIILQKSSKCVSYPSIDIKGDVHSIKIVPYDTNGYRIKNHGGCGQEMVTYKPEQNKGAYFGTHLLNDRPNAPIALVESEKSAIIGALFAPNYIWIATGGKAFFNGQSDKLEPLRGRMIYIFPDADAVEQWRTHVEQMRANGYNVIYREDIIGQFSPESKIDIADLMIWEILD